MKNTTDVPIELREKLAEYLNELKDKRKLGFNQLSLKAGINAKSLNLILKGETKRINPYQLKKIATALRIDYKELYKIVGYLDEEETLDTINLDETITTINIPLFESISAGCGFEEGEIIDYIVVPELKNPQLYFAIKVVGDSMVPSIPNHSIIVIKRDESIPDGKIGAFITDTGAIVKRIRRSENENILFSDNPEYPPIVLRKGDTYHECGRVVKVILDL